MPEATSAPVVKADTSTVVAQFGTAAVRRKADAPPVTTEPDPVDTDGDDDAEPAPTPKPVAKKPPAEPKEDTEPKKDPEDDGETDDKGEKKKEPPKFQRMEREIDWGNGQKETYVIESEADLDRLIKLSKGLQSKQRTIHKEAETAKQESARLLQLLKTNPREAFKLAEVDFDKINEDHFVERYRRSQMTPEQLEQQKEFDRLTAIERENQTLKDEVKRAKAEPLARQYEAQVLQQMAVHKLPHLPQIMTAIFDEWQKAKADGLEPSFEEATRIVAQEYFGRVKIPKGIKYADLVGRFDPETVAAIEAAVIEKLNAASGDRGQSFTKDLEPGEVAGINERRPGGGKRPKLSQQLTHW